MDTQSICTQDCQNDGTCTAPDACTCSPCYTGAICESVLSGSPGPLGLEDGSVTNNQFTASSTYLDLSPYKGRLNDARFWAASSGSQPCWLQVDFLTSVVITGIKTQGAGTVGQWIKTFQLKFGTDVNALKDVAGFTNKPENIAKNDRGRNKIEIPNCVWRQQKFCVDIALLSLCPECLMPDLIEYLTENKYETQVPSVAKHRPVIFLSGSPGPLGLEDGSVTDNQFTASSIYFDLSPYKGRLNDARFWAASSGYLPCWLQVDFLSHYWH
ncbi:lactadherin-like [Amphiura filiformis]|uniref:lactadherin-like n=1 Tax=Amphiura filiformis TaxID=82378 RepID=UPI003B20F5C2